MFLLEQLCVSGTLQDSVKQHAESLIRSDQEQNNLGKLNLMDGFWLNAFWD